MELENIVLKIENFLKEKIGNKRAVISLDNNNNSYVLTKLLYKLFPKENIFPVAINHDENSSIVQFADRCGISFFPSNINTDLNNFADDPKYITKKESEIRLMTNLILRHMSIDYNAIIVGTISTTQSYFYRQDTDIEPLIDLFQTEIDNLARYLDINIDPSEDYLERKIGYRYKSIDSLILFLNSEPIVKITDIAFLSEFTGMTMKHIVNTIDMAYKKPWENRFRDNFHDFILKIYDNSKY